MLALGGRVPERAQRAYEQRSSWRRHSARGIYRFVLERLTPDVYCRNIQRLWNMLHDTGSREIVTISPTHVRSVIFAWPGHHRVLCVASTETMAAVFVLMGARDVQVRRLACVSDGASECTAELRWRA